MPIKKLKCLTDGFSVEESSLIIQNLGLPEDFQKHFLKEHKNPNPQEDKDYRADDMLVSG